MSDRIGKYYWIKTEAGKEIGFKRDSGAWEMHGIDCTEDLRSEILDVYEEVANGDSKETEKALVITDVMHLLTEYEKFASGDNYIGNKQLIDKQIKEFIYVNCV